MRTTQWLISLFLASSLFATTAVAADTTPAKDTGKLETMHDTPAVIEHNMKDCPMHQGRKACSHKQVEPCPYHKDEKHHGGSHHKGDHKHLS